MYFQLRCKLKEDWLIDSESKIEERFNSKLYGIGDSYNDEGYMWDYKDYAKQVQYIDKTGYVNCRNMALRQYNNTPVNGVSSNGQMMGQQNTQMNVNHHNPGSAHAMMAVNNVMQGHNQMGGINLSGHHSAMDMHSNLQNQKQNQWTGSNSANMLSG